MCHTHYGHKVELQHLRLSENRRLEIASKLQQEIARTNILSGIRDNISSEFQRIHLLEKKDLANITKSFGIKVNLFTYFLFLFSVFFYFK